LGQVRSNLQIRFGLLQLLIWLPDTMFPEVGGPQIWILSTAKWVIDSGSLLSRGFFHLDVAEPCLWWIKFRCHETVAWRQTSVGLSCNGHGGDTLKGWSEAVTRVFYCELPLK